MRKYYETTTSERNQLQINNKVTPIRSEARAILLHTPRTSSCSSDQLEVSPTLTVRTLSESHSGRPVRPGSCQLSKIELFDTNVALLSTATRRELRTQGCQ